MLMQISAKFEIDVNFRDRNGDTAFHNACRNRQKSIVQRIIQNETRCNFDFDAKDSYGKTVFEIAYLSGCKDIVNLLDKRNQRKINKMFKSCS